MGKTSIEWTRSDDSTPGFTWNPVRGCSRISPGCGGANHQGGCYAEKIAARFSDPGQAFHGFAERPPHGGRWTGKVSLVPSAIDRPLRWRKPRRIFVNSMSDLFHNNLPEEAIDAIFAVMALCPQHTFQVLTKRPERMRQYMNRPIGDLATGQRGYLDALNHAAMNLTGRPVFPSQKFGMIPHPGWPLPNVWLGTSVEDRPRLSRIDRLRATPAAVRFISFEPLLEDLREIDLTGIDWAIIGGESGPRASKRLALAISTALLHATMTERDTCATVAEKRPTDLLNNRAGDTEMRIRRSIAAEIRASRT